MSTEQYAVVWICIILFFATSVITILALLNLIKLGPNARTHEFYLKLFVSAILIQVAGGSVAVYVSFVKVKDDVDNRNRAGIVEIETKVRETMDRVNRLEGTSRAQSQSTPPKRWILIRNGDCTGGDVDESSGSEPDEDKCKDRNSTAVCWDNVLFKNGGRPWCTYKRIAPSSCNGGAAAGRLFQCNP